MCKPVWKDINILKLKETFLINLVCPIDGDFKFGVLLLVFVRFLGGDAGNLYRNGFLERVNVSPLFLFPLNPGISWKWTENSLFWLEYLSVLCLKVSIYQFCRKQSTKLENLPMHSQCALSEPISSSRKTRKLTVCRFIYTSIYFWRIGIFRRLHLDSHDEKILKI